MIRPFTFGSVTINMGATKTLATKFGECCRWRHAWFGLGGWVGRLCSFDTTARGGSRHADYLRVGLRCIVVLRVCASRVGIDMGVSARWLWGNDTAVTLRAPQASPPQRGHRQASRRSVRVLGHHVPFPFECERACVDVCPPLPRLLAVPCRYPFGQDLQEFTDVVHRFVERYVDVYYASDADVLSDRHLAAFWDAIRCVSRGVWLLCCCCCCCCCCCKV